MCYNCGDPGRFCPDRPNNPYDPLPEGVQLQRLKPETERLVLQAERVGYLTSENRHISGDLRQAEKTLECRDKRVEELKYDNRNLDRDLTRALERERSLESRVKRLTPKKPKVTKKGKK